MRTSRLGSTLALIALLAAAVAIIAGSTPTVFAQQDELTSGEAVEGVISDKEGNTYTIGATMGQLITISMVSDEINSLLFISDADGTKLAYDDDSGGNNNALLVYLVQADGTFTITAKSVGSGTGAYTLTPLLTDPAIIELGSSVTLTPGTVDELLYAVFVASSGTVVDVWASTQGEDDVTVELIGVDTQPIEFDDDDGPFDNSLLRRVVLSGDGLYLVQVGTSRSDTPFTAPIDVIVEGTEQLFITDAPQKVTLSGHDLGTEVFTFEATAGIVYRITAIAENGSGVEMTLFDTDGRVDPDLKTSSALKITWEWLSGTDGFVRLDVHPNLFRNDGDFLSIMLETVE